MFLPATCETGVVQERVAAPSTCTVHAPHSPAPQPNFVPVSWRVSRRTQRRGVSRETLTLRSLPLTRRVMSAMEAPMVVCEASHGSGNVRKGECGIPSHMSQQWYEVLMFLLSCA